MYPASKEKDAVHSGTGVYYQAIPAVGVDGKNIMKLIPVQMVNGQFFRTDINKPRTDSTPQKVTLNIASAPVPFTHQQIVRKQVSTVNALSNPVELDHGYSLNKQSLQQQTVNLTAKVPPIATPVTNCGKSVKRPCQLPVTVKSPALPRGHYLQIPANAQVRTVPASELPPSVKKQIFTLSGNSSPGSSSSSVVYVSPVTTVSPNDSGLDSLNLLSDTSNNTSCGSQTKGSKPILKLIPKISQRPNSPIKWVIEEEDSSTAQSLNPLNSPSVTTEILRAVAERETVGKDCDIIKKTPFVASEILRAVAERGTVGKDCDIIKQTVSQSVPANNGQGQENALVVCNGKVFFLAKKCNLPFKVSQSGTNTSATRSYKFNRTTARSSQQSVDPVLAQTRQDLRIIVPDESDDVIDLCDDDDSTPSAASLDEDNVIFVSYIPPKSDSGSTNSLMLKTQMSHEKKTIQMGTSSSNSVTQEKSQDDRTGDSDTDEGSALRGRQPGQSIGNAVSNVTRVCGSTVTNLHEDSNRKSRQSISTQLVESMEVDVETEIPTGPSTLDSSSETHSLKEEDTHKMQSSPNPAPCWTSSPAPKPCQMADHLLRQIFRITADVKVCLQRIDENSAWSAALTPHTDITLKSKCHSGQSSLSGTSCDVETAPVIGYVEPIDEDFPSTDENGISKSHNTTQTCVDLNTNTRRIGRTRKRTMCPCCTSGTLDPAVKFSTRLEEPEKWTWTMSKKEGRTKAPGKDGKTSGRISCLTAKNKQKCKTYEVPASDSLTTSSMDFDELKQHKEIKKLRDLLKEKEAALELMRNMN